MVGATKIRIDENEVSHFTKVKKFGAPAAAENTKRAALGDLQNRAVLRLASAKDAAQKELDGKLRNAIQKTKPRVDTHWKKAPGAVATSTKLNTVEAEQPKKGITRSNSLRGAGFAAGSTALQRNAVAGLNKQKTLAKKVVEKKLQQPKVAKVKAAEEEKVSNAVSTGEHVSLRREESNISLKSLKKLKAALIRDASKVNVAAKQEAPLIKSELKSSAEKEDNTASNVANNKCEIKIISVQTYSPEVLEAVEDIDAGDSDQLLLVSEFVNDIYNYLFQLEDEQYIRKNHLDDQYEVNPKMRAVLIDWLNEVHLQFRLTPETFQMSVAIIDRYLQEVKDTKRTNLQLVGVTALFLASKYEELVPPAIDDFVYITDNTYTSKQVVQMELKIFKALDCNLSRPLPIHFLRRFSKAAKVEDIHHAMAKYFIELASIEYDLASYKPSEIAAASLFLALHLLKDNSKLPTGFNNKHWSATMQWYSHYTADHLRPIAKKIATVVRQANIAKLKAVYTKYQSSKLHKISTRSELYDTLIDSIINSSD